jgi:hypothetical protein
LLPTDGLRLAANIGNAMLENVVPGKAKHFSAHVAIEQQSSIALSGLVLFGQQSMSCAAERCAIAIDFMATLAAPAAGSIATDSAIRSARKVRPMRMESGNGADSAKDAVCGIRRNGNEPECTECEQNCPHRDLHGRALQYRRPALMRKTALLPLEAAGHRRAGFLRERPLLGSVGPAKRQGLVRRRHPRLRRSATKLADRAGPDVAREARRHEHITQPVDVSFSQSGDRQGVGYGSEQ